MELIGAADDEIRVVRLRKRHHLLQHRRLEEVIRIQEGQELPAGVCKAKIARGSGPRVLLGEDSDARVLLRVLFKDLRAAVIRTVIHADHFDVAQRLAQDRIQVPAQVRRYVVYGYYH